MMKNMSSLYRSKMKDYIDYIIFTVYIYRMFNLKVNLF